MKWLTTIIMLVSFMMSYCSTGGTLFLMVSTLTGLDLMPHMLANHEAHGLFPNDTPKARLPGLSLH
jgi:hypothetical protein